MKILLVSAKKSEIASCINKFKMISSRANVSSFHFGKHSVDVLITGAGMTATAFHLGKILGKKYDWAVNAGIAGSFRKNIPLGSVVNVISDCFADFGAEDGGKFLTAKEIGLVSGFRFQVSGFRFQNKIIDSLSKVKGVTVNTVHGNTSSIKKLIKKFNPDVESMEGAAFLLACNYEKTPCLQIRAISNFVERRNKKKWKMKLAISNLTGALEKIFSNL